MTTQLTDRILLAACTAFVLGAAVVFAVVPRTTHALMNLDKYIEALQLETACTVAQLVHDYYVFTFDQPVQRQALQFSVPTNEQNMLMLSTAAMDTSINMAHLWKECVVDPEMWEVHDKSLQIITPEIIEWHRSGYLDDSIQYIQEPIEHYDDLAMWGIDRLLNPEDSPIVQRVCEPFRPEVRRTAYANIIQPDYLTDQSKRACSHQSANLDWNTYVEAGDMMTPGMGLHTMFSATYSPNNPIGAYFEAEGEAVYRTAQSLSAEADHVAYGDGFHPDYCEYNDQSPGYDGVCTPGKVLIETLRDWLEFPLTETEAADELSEKVDEDWKKLQLRIYEEHLLGQ